jgi:enhancing lycopene biosynthesis protein 2
LPECEVTVGKSAKSKDWPYSYTAEDVRNLGAVTFEKDVNEIQIDANYKIVSTPAFMKNATYFEIYEGIGKMVDQVLELAD